MVWRPPTILRPDKFQIGVVEQRTFRCIAQRNDNCTSNKGVERGNAAHAMESEETRRSPKEVGCVARSKRSLWQGKS